MASMVEEEKDELPLTELRLPDGLGSDTSGDPIGDPDAEVIVYPFDERYAFTRMLGAGGMGEVRLCRDRMIGREVAMKVILPSMSSRSEIHARFVREARVQGQLEHPAIV